MYTKLRRTSDTETSETMVLDDVETCCQKVLWGIVKLIYVIVSTILFTPPLVVITVVSLLYKQFVRLIMWCHYGDKVTFMTSVDAFFSIEKPQSRWIVTCAFSGGRKATMQWLRDEVLLKKFFPKNGEIENDVTKFLRVPLYKYGYRFWVNTGEPFDVDYHIRMFDGLSDNIDDVTDEKLMEYVGSVVNKEFPANKPPWEILCIPNYLKKTKNTDGKNTTEKVWIFITRIHHGYGDGIHLFKNFFFRYADEPFIPQFSEPLKLTFMQSILMTFGVIAYLPYIMKLFFLPEKNPLRGAETSGNKLVGMSAYIDLKLIQSVKRKYNVSFTSVLLTAFGESLHQYFVSKGKQVPKFIEAVFSIPMKVPKADDMNINNYISGCLVKVSTEKMSPVKRLKLLHHELQREFHSPAPYAVHWTVISFNNFPEYLTGALATQAPGTVFFSSVPGPSKAPVLGGHPIDNILFWVPHKGNLGVSASFMSLCGKIRMGLCVDKTFITTPEAVSDIISGWEKCIHSLAKD